MNPPPPTPPPDNPSDPQPSVQPSAEPPPPAPSEPLVLRRTTPGRVAFSPQAPHDLILVWSLWLIIAGALTVLSNAGHLWFRVLVLVAFLGLMLAWPAYRLSQDFDTSADLATGRPTPQLRPPLLLLVDWLLLTCVLALALAALYQRSTLVIRVEQAEGSFTTNTWTPRQVLCLNAAIAAWSLLTGAIAALGCQARRGGFRAAAMVACVLILIGPHLLQTLGLFADDKPFSAFHMVWKLTAQSFEVDTNTAIQYIVIVALAAVLAWAAALWPRSQA